MKYGKIPTWQECQNLQERNETLPVEKRPLDPIERFILNHEPFILNDEPYGDYAKRKFRSQLQEVVDYLQ